MRELNWTDAAVGLIASAVVEILAAAIHLFSAIASCTVGAFALWGLAEGTAYLSYVLRYGDGANTHLRAALDQGAYHPIGAIGIGFVAGAVLWVVFVMIRKETGRWPPLWGWWKL